MTKQFKYPCAVALEGLTQEQAVNLEKTFVALGANPFDVFSEGSLTAALWKYYGVDCENDTIVYDDITSFSEFGEEEATIYTYDEILVLAGMSEPITLDKSPNDDEWIDNTGEEPQYLLDGGIIDVMFNNGSVLTGVTDDNRYGNRDCTDWMAKDWSLFGDDSQIKAWRKAAVISSKEECDTSNPDVAVNAQSVSESNTESFKATMLIELTVCNEIFKLSKEEAYKIYSDLKDIFGD